MKPTIVLAGLREPQRLRCAVQLRRQAASVFTARGAAAASRRLLGRRVDALVVDESLIVSPDGSLGGLLRAARRLGVPVIGVGAWPAVDGLELSARLEKPLSPDALARALARLAVLRADGPA